MGGNPVQSVSAVFHAFYATPMLCLIAGGKHHAPLSGIRVGRPKLGVSGDDFGGGTMRPSDPSGARGILPSGRIKLVKLAGLVLKVNCVIFDFVATVEIATVLPSPSRVPFNYGGLHTTPSTSSFLFFVGLLEKARVHPKYRTHCQAGWIVHTRLP